MFMKTIAVGPLAPTLFCVTGGTTVAMHREDRHEGAFSTRFAAVVRPVLRVRLPAALESDMVKCVTSKSRSAVLIENG